MTATSRSSASNAVASAGAKPPRVSVVIPVLNRPLAVRQAIDSVLAQTVQDFELIVVDDGSTDATPETLASLSDPRIRVIRHPQRRGGSAARNTGIRAARADYVAFLDSDDEWLPTKLERQLELFGRSQEHVALVYTGMQGVYADGSRRTYLPLRIPNLARALLTDNVIGGTSVGMLRRSALEAVGGFDESLPAAQEMDLWLRVCERFTADFVPEVLVRVEKGSDQGRITASIPATTGARELFRRKHRSKMVQQGVLHLHLRESGWWYLRGARDPRAARRCAIEAVRFQPLAPLSHALLLATVVPMAWLDHLARWKHRLTALRSGGRSSVATELATSQPSRGQRQ
jgi:hypothetical protein